MARRKKLEVDEMFVDEALALVALVAGQEVESEVEKTQVGHVLPKEEDVGGGCLWCLACS